MTRRRVRIRKPVFVACTAALLASAGLGLTNHWAVAQAPAPLGPIDGAPTIALGTLPAATDAPPPFAPGPIRATDPIFSQDLAGFVPLGLPLATLPQQQDVLPELPLAAGMTPDAIVGPDDRVEAPVTSYPYSAIGRIDAGLGTTTWSCTGALVARGIMLTNRHCVYDEAQQRLATFLSFTPGYRRGAAPFGVAYGRLVYLSDIIQSTGLPLDYALVTLSDTLGDRAGWLGVKPLQTGWVPSPAWWTLAGYGFNWYGNRGNTTVQTYNPTPCRLRDLSESNWVVGHDCDMGSGNSGSPIFAWFDGGNGRLMPYAVAVNNAEWRLADKFSSCGAYRYGQCGNLGVQSNAFLPTLLSLLRGK